MLNIIKNTINRVFASGVDSDASAFITATGLSGTTQKSAITTLVKDLKSSGLWSKMKAVYPMVTDQRNLLSYTEDFSNAYWIQSGATITANSTVAPNGTTTADTINTTSAGYIYTTGNYNGITQTISYYIKKKTDSIAFIGVYDTVDKGFWFNLDTGVITQTTGTISNQTLTDVGNGWYRASFTFTNGAATTYIPSPGPRVASGSATRGTDLYIWGAQLENGTSVSAYQPILTTPSAFMASQMKYNLKDARDLDAAFRLTWSGGWTYSATGATPNGTNAYADTRFNLLTNLPGYNNSFSVYFRQNLYGTYKVGASGSSFDRGMSAHLGWTNSSGTLYHDNLGRNTMANSAYGTFDAYHISSVTSTSSQKLYRNGVMKLSGAATAGLTQPSINFYFGASNDNGTANYFDPKQIAFGTLSTSLTDQDAQLLNQIVEKYQVALSRGVQAAQSFYYNSAYSNESNTYLYSTQITGTTQVSAINTLINGLKANNLWTKMKAVYPFVTDYRNILAYTEDFANAYWLKYRVNVSGNTTTAPNGTLTADSLSDTAVNDAHQLYLSLLATAPNTYTFSFYVKANNSTKNLAIYPFTLSAAGGTGSGGVILTQTGTFVANIGSGVSSYSSTNVGDGWYRISVTGYTTNTNEVRPVIGFANGTNETYLGDGSGIYIWGAQFEIGASASTYQPVLAANNYATNVASQMKFNLVNPQDTDAAFRLAFSGGWTYSTNGAQPNGTNGYADTKLVPSTAIASANSQHYSIYSRTNVAEARYGFGNDDVRYGLKWSDNITYAKMGTSESGFGTNSTTLGMHILNRVDSSNLSSIIRGTKTTVANSISALSALNILLGARQLSGSVDSYGTRQLALVSIGDGLTDSDITALNQLITEYQTALSRNV